MGLPVKLTHWRSEVFGQQVQAHLPVLLLRPPERFDMFGAHTSKDQDGYTDIGWQLIPALDRVAGVEGATVYRYSVRLDLAKLIGLEQVLADLQVTLGQVLGPDLTITVTDGDAERAAVRAQRRARAAAARKGTRDRRPTKDRPQ